MLQHSIHHPHYHLSRMGEMKRIIWAHAIGAFGGGMVTIFIPLFLLNSGYSFESVLTFLALEGVTGALGTLLGAYLCRWIGTNRLMALGLVAHATQLGLLLTLEQSGWPLWSIAVFYGLFIGLYSPGFHINFSLSRAHEKTGSQVSITQIIKIMASALAPAIGGVAASALGINWIYGFAIGLQILATVPLLSGPEPMEKSPVRFSKLPFKKVWAHGAVNMANATTTIAEVMIWPVFVFFLLPSYAGVGILSSVIAIASILTAFYVGKREARKPRRYISEGVTMAGLSDAFRLLAENATHVFGVNFLGGVGNSLYFTPYMATFYANADKVPRRAYIYFMDFAWHLAWALFFLLLYAVSFALPDKETLMVGIALAIPANFVIRKLPAL